MVFTLFLFFFFLFFFFLGGGYSLSILFLFVLCDLPLKLSSALVATLRALPRTSSNSDEKLSPKFLPPITSSNTFAPDSIACCLIDFNKRFPASEVTAFLADFIAVLKSGVASLAKLLNNPPNPCPIYLKNYYYIYIYFYYTLYNIIIIYINIPLCKRGFSKVIIMTLF